MAAAIVPQRNSDVKKTMSLVSPAEIILIFLSTFLNMINAGVIIVNMSSLT
jgi:hypothetical protein